MPEDRPIALIGLSGAGKSSAGRLLATRLGWPLRDTDALVVVEAGRSVAAIFAEQGEPRFRDLESAALRSALAAGPCVVATGGGIVLRAENRALLRARAAVAWLDAPTAALLDRLRAHDEARPLLQGDDPAARLEALRAARAALYAEVAHVRVETAGQAIEAICDTILHAFDLVDG
ncbi:MAG TPA: shikimate kinase [Roseiflexaceae bacterium]